MRLRQAHAILEATTALEPAGLGFELAPLHHDYPGTPPHITRDSMTGFTEIEGPEGVEHRTYSVDLRPGPDDDTIEAILTLGLGPDPECLLYAKHNVALPVGEAERFRGLVGARVAEKIVEEVRKHEERVHHGDA